MKNVKKIAIVCVIVLICGCASKKRLYDLTIVSSRNVPLGQQGVELKKIAERVEGRSEKEDWNLKEAIDQALNVYPGSIALSDAVVYKKGKRLIVEGFPLYPDEGTGVPQKAKKGKEKQKLNSSIQLGGAGLFEYDGNYYSVVSDSTVEVIRIPKEVLDQMRYNWQRVERINIPTEVEYEGKVYEVVRIEAEAFKGFSDLRTITLPNTITSIGVEAFKDCRNLKSIVIPEKVTVIDVATFCIRI